MKRYKFFLLVFFLTLSVHSANNSQAIRQSSGRNIEELVNIGESSERAMQPSSINPGSNVIIHNTSSGQIPNMSRGTRSSSLSNVNCKTYEGKVFEKGEAGYNDCIRTIKHDRQGIKNIP